jgi:hypothetical protein
MLRVMAYHSRNYFQPWPPADPKFTVWSDSTFTLKERNKVAKKWVWTSPRVWLPPLMPDMDLEIVHQDGGTLKDFVTMMNNPALKINKERDTRCLMIVWNLNELKTYRSPGISSALAQATSAFAKNIQVYNRVMVLVGASSANWGYDPQWDVYVDQLIAIFHDFGILALNSCVLADSIQQHIHPADNLHYLDTPEVRHNYQSRLRTLLQFMRIMNPPALGYKLDEVLHPIAAREIGDDLRAYPIGIPPRAGEYRSGSAGIPSAVDLAFPTSTTGTIQTVPPPTHMPASGGIPAAGPAEIGRAHV